MAEIIYKFDTINDKDHIKLHAQCRGMYVALFDFSQFLRDEIKYNNKDYEEIQKKFHEILEENNVELDY